MTIDLDALTALYEDLHRHPELGRQEHRTAGIVAERLTALGYDVTTGVGGTGVVGVLARGEGPSVMLRADMDGLPVREETGLAYASTATATAADGTEVPVMHACGHDIHVSCLLGAAEQLAAEQDWTGRLVLVFQPDEEGGTGARSMLADGLLERFGTPVVVLGQHVAPLPVGLLGVTPGPAFAATDMIRVVLHGKGGHGSRPESAVDPVVMGAALVLRLQTVVSREVSGSDTVVLTVGTFHAGTRGNIIPDQAVLEISLRSTDPDVRDRAVAAIERMARAEAAAAGAPREPEVEVLFSLPAVVNDEGACAQVAAAFAETGRFLVVDPGAVTGSEDVGMLSDAAGVPGAYWLLGGADPALFAGAASIDELRKVLDGVPANHSPHYAPVGRPTLEAGVAALVGAARSYLERSVALP